MEAQPKLAHVPGATILGGAAAGFSYEGVWHDALAREDAAWKQQPPSRESSDRPERRKPEARRPRLEPSA